jgi:hypothetical protein
MKTTQLLRLLAHDLCAPLLRRIGVDLPAHVVVAAPGPPTPPVEPAETS